MATRKTHRSQRHFLDLLLYKSFADLKSEAALTRGGMLWWFLEPVLHMTIYYALFAVLLHRWTEDFVVFLLIGLVSWRWFNTSLIQGAGSIISGKGLMQQVYISRTFFPSVILITQSFKFAVTLAVLLLFIWIYGLLPTTAYVALPLVVLVQFIWIAGCVYFFAAITPFLPDLRIVLSNLLRGLLFFSGIFYDGDSIPEHLQFWFYLNPIASLIKAYREVLMHASAPDWSYLLYVAVLGVLLLAIGKRLIARFDYLYPRVVL